MLVGALHAVERVIRGKIRTTEAGGVKSVLFLEYMLPLGCCVHMTPVFEALKRLRPGLTVMVATRGLGAQVLRHSPYVDHVIVTPDPLTELKAAVFCLRDRLRELRADPDCLLTGASDQRTKIALLGALGGRGWRGGFTVNPWLYQRPLAYDKGLSLIGNNLKLAQLLGFGLERAEPRVFFSHQCAQTARTLLAEANPEGLPVVVMVTQNSGGQSTGWHTDRFAQVIRYASERLGCAVVYVGTSKDEAAIRQLQEAAGGSGYSIAGRTCVTELAAVLAMSDAMVTLDTGTMHVGRAVGTPMVVLGPSWQRPLEWLPLQVQNVRVLRGTDVDRVPENYRLDEISADGVMQGLNELLGLYAPSSDDRRRRVEQSVSTVDHLAATS
jgi:ADP-heptose:LPS heptosyltransferase